MDYYHDQDPPPGKRPKKSKGWLFPVLVGIIIGVLVVIIAMPSLLKSNLLPQAWTNNTETDNGTLNQDSSNSYVNVDVSTQVTDVVNKVAPAVVGVINIQQQMDFWQDQASEVGTGSGVIYKKEDGNAYIITNHHVVEGADTVEVVLSNEKHIEAKIMGSDLFSDLAVLRVDGKHIKQVIQMGSSENVKVGEPAIAIGNPLGMKFSGSVTQGVISGKQRTIPQDFNQDGRADWQAEVLQTDAAINPGNSGGALINIDGQLIGINSMKINETSVEGIGFAIPIDTARPLVNELEKKGEITRPYLGVEIYSLEEVPQSEWDSTLSLPKGVDGGVYIWSVERLSPADQAGLKRLDVITQIDGKKVMNMIELRKILYQEKKVGDDLKVTFYRDGKKQSTTVKLGQQR
ncbi:serine protease [Virgibacillus phasianinus]|uniref:Serine protease n=1 Tax=Virgibacillus phasianinus TaxID=2017483 RepID=A0A220U153_9BACI|nr:S1C family serine protease [Virgibacillus phasianinus]ASK61800.1 serine protease [Virgibacillus phasianinus]